MRKIFLSVVAAIALLGCSKEIPVCLDHPLEVDLPSDVEFDSDALLYVNISEDAADFSALVRYVLERKPDVLLAQAVEADKDALVSAVRECGLDFSVSSNPCDGKVAVIASDEKMEYSSLGNGWAAASFTCCSVVVGQDSGTIMEDTSGFDDRIFFLESASDPSEKFYRKTFCNFIAAQWGGMMPTSSTSLTDYVFARPSQWSRAGAVSIDRNSEWKHCPISFTIKKEL